MSLPEQDFSKPALRYIAKYARKNRAKLDENDAAKLATFSDRLPLQPGDTVAAYAPLGTEISPLLLLEALSERGHEVCLPVVATPKAPLIFRRWRAEQLEPGPYGTFHPGETQPELVPDLILVPLLGFDSKGHRLGYGGGYYDRTLNLLRHRGDVFACGVAYAAQEVDALPFDPYDEQLDAVLTEEGYREFER